MLKRKKEFHLYPFCYSTKLYELIGFKEIEVYRYNPIQDAMYMELNL